MNIKKAEEQTGLSRANIRFYEQGEALSWEGGSRIEARGSAAHRAAAWAAAAAVLLAITGFLAWSQTVPWNRGPLTVEEFAENYNQMVKFRGTGGRTLEADGTWYDPADDPGVVHIVIGGGSDTRSFFYETEDGLIRKITFVAEGSRDSLHFSGLDQQLLSTLSFVRAQKGLISFSDQTGGLLRKLQADPLGSWEAEANGVRITARADCSGWIWSPDYDMLLPEEEARPFRIEWIMELI